MKMNIEHTEEIKKNIANMCELVAEQVATMHQLWNQIQDYEKQIVKSKDPEIIKRNNEIRDEIRYAKKELKLARKVRLTFNDEKQRDAFDWYSDLEDKMYDEMMYDND